MTFLHRRSNSGVAFALFLLVAVSCVLAPSLAAAQESPVAAKALTAVQKSPAVAAALDAARTRPAATYPESEPPTKDVVVAEDGVRFFISKVMKGREGADYHRGDDGKIAFRYGLRFALIAEDDESFYVKVPLLDDATLEAIAEDTEARRQNSARKQELKDTQPQESEALSEEDFALFLSASDSSAKIARVAPFSKGLPTSGHWRQDFVVVDFNGDGKPDIVHGPARKGRTSPNVFLNEGAGSWKHERLRTSSGRLDYGDVVVADFDGDGTLDLALAMHLLGTTVLYQEAGTFRERAEGFDRPDFAHPNSPFGKRAPWSSRAMVAADLDRDGDLDLIAAGEGAEAIGGQRLDASSSMLFSEGLAVYLNNGDAPWTPVRFKGLPSGADKLALAQLDDDPQPELLVAWLLGKESNLIVDFKGEGSDLEAESLPLPSLGPETSFASAIAGGDLIPGGTDEIVVGRRVALADDSWESRVELHWRDEQGQWQRQILMSNPFNERITDIAVADFDADGKLDVGASTGYGRVFLFRNLGLAKKEPRFEAIRIDIPGGGFGCAVEALALVDLDADGKAELITALAGDPTHVPGMRTIQGCPGGGSLSSWKIGDFVKPPGTTKKSSGKSKKSSRGKSRSKR